MSGTIQKNDIITPEALKVFQEIVAGFKQVMDAAQKTGKNIKDSGLEEMTFQEKELAKQHQELGKVTAKLESFESSYNKEIVRTKEELKKKQAELREEITGQKAAKKAQDEATASQKEGNAILVKHIKNTKSFNAIVKKGQQRLREQTKEQKRLTREQEKATRAAQRQTKSGGGLRKMFVNLTKSALSYAAAMFGITEIIRFFTSTLLKLTTKLDSLDFSMKTVIESSSELAQTNIFLSKTAINYGQDILVLTERYIKFRAATMQANMSAQETQQIFDSAAKAAAVLGLKTDEVNGVFLALEQMISKGKVTTEELRRQLGERLPGAFGIMADAIGVTLRELDKMLKAGEVLSAEALPKFAVALEEAYGIQAVTKVNTLAAAQGRLKTSWVSFVDELEASEPYIKTINSLANAITRLKESMRSEGDIIKTKEGEILSNVLDGYEKLITKEERREFIIQKIGELQQKRLDAQQDEQYYQEKLNSTSSKTANIIARIVSGGTLSAKEYDKLQETLTGIEGTTLRWSRYLNLSKTESKAIYNVIETLQEKFQNVADTSVNIFDFDTFKNKLNEAKKEYEKLSLVQNDLIRKQMIEFAAFYDEDKKTYSEYLSFELERLKDNINESEALYKSYQKEIGEDATRDQLKELEKRYSNWSSYLDAYAQVRKKISELNKSESEKEIKAEKNKISFYDAYRQRIEDMFEAHYIERLSMARGNIEEEIAIEREKIKHQLNVNDITLTERAKLNARLRELDDELLQYEIDQEISGIYERADEARIAEAERAREEFQSTKKRGKDKQLIMAESAMNMIEIERNAIQQILKIEELSIDERKKYEQDLAKLRERYAEADIRLTEQKEAKKREEIRNTLNAVKEINQASFDFNMALNERAMAANEAQFTHETELAGENAEQKAMAEVRYNQKKRELQRKQAISNKASAAFSVIIDTAAAIMEGLKQTGFLGIPLVPIIAGIGAFQLGTVLAQPIPQFATGTKDAPETFEAGEKGRELVITRSGDTFLTPNEPTLFSDKSFIGSTILPNDQTEMILSGRSGGSSVDLTSTNTLLKDIRDKKENKETIEYSGGYKIVRKNGFVGKYRVT